MGVNARDHDGDSIPPGTAADEESLKAARDVFVQRRELPTDHGSMRRLLAPLRRRRRELDQLDQSLPADDG